MASSVSTVQVEQQQQKPAVKASSPPIISKVDPMMSNHSVGDANVRVLGLDEYKEAALSIAEAFQDDEVSMYFINTPDREAWSKKQKWDLHASIMEYITYAHLLKGLVVSAGPNYDCVGLW